LELRFRGLELRFMGLVRLEPRDCQGHLGLVVGILIHLQVEGKGIRVQIKGFGLRVYVEASMIKIQGLKPLIYDLEGLGLRIDILSLGFQG
jgi:hypothetical protein